MPAWNQFAPGNPETLFTNISLRNGQYIHDAADTSFDWGFGYPNLTGQYLKVEGSGYQYDIDDNEYYLFNTGTTTTLTIYSSDGYPVVQMDGLNMPTSQLQSTILNGSTATLRTFIESQSWTFNGSAGNDSIKAGNQADTVVAHSGNDVVYGLDGVDTLDGGSGNDTLDGGAGADVMSGGLDNDTFYVDSAADKVVEAVGGGTDTVITTVTFALGTAPEVEVLKTSDAASLAAIDLAGSNTANTITGNAGANTLNGGGGGDTMQGLGGNDRYYVDDATDSVVEATGGGSDKVFAYVSYVLGGGSEVESLSAQNAAGTTTINLTGNEFGQGIIGNAGTNSLSGGGGSDGLQGLLGNDTLAGGTGNDSFFFNTALGPTNVDHITDFANVSGDNDLIRLEDTIFAGLNAGALVAGDTFASNATGAANANTHVQIIYNTTTGALTFDSNGNSSGGATQFAVIDNHAGLTGAAALAAADFLVY